MDNWLHKCGEFNILGCRMAPKGPLHWLLFLIVFCGTVLLMPLAILLFGIGGGGYLSLRIMKDLDERIWDYHDTCCKQFLCYLLLSPIYLPILAIGLSLGTAVGAIGAGLLTIPGEIVHLLIFIRTCYWWCKSRTTR